MMACVTPGRDSSFSGISQVAKLPSTRINLVGGYYIVPKHVWKATVNEAEDAIDSFTLWTSPYVGLARLAGLTKAPPKAFQNVTGGDDKDLSEHSATVGVMIATMAIGPGGGPSKVASKVPDRVGKTLEILKAGLKPAAAQLER
jgi:hypothetical protein